LSIAIVDLLLWYLSFLSLLLEQVLLVLAKTPAFLARSGTEAMIVVVLF